MFVCWGVNHSVNSNLSNEIDERTKSLNFANDRWQIRSFCKLLLTEDEILEYSGNLADAFREGLDSETIAKAAI